MKRQIKRALANLLYWSGFLHLYKHIRLRGKGLVLMYHRVLPAEQRAQSFSSDGIIVEPQTFERHLRLLRKHFSLVSVDELAERLRAGAPLQGYPCLISFDDGWADNHEHALPLLRRHRAPAVIFLPTDYIGTGQLFWQERLGRLVHGLYLQRERVDPAVIRRLGLEAIFRLQEPALRPAIKAFVTDQKSRAYAEIDALLHELSSVVDERSLPASVDRYLDWPRARELREHGISLGAHAVSHRILTRLSEPEVHHEAAESKRRLEQELGAPVTSFAYPNGDYDAGVAEAVTAQGYTLAFSTRPGFISAEDDRFSLRRCNVHDDATATPALFLSRILGLL